MHVPDESMWLYYLIEIVQIDWIIKVRNITSLEIKRARFVCLSSLLPRKTSCFHRLLPVPFGSTVANVDAFLADWTQQCPSEHRCAFVDISRLRSCVSIDWFSLCHLLVPGCMLSIEQSLSSVRSVLSTGTECLHNRANSAVRLWPDKISRSDPYEISVEWRA